MNTVNSPNFTLINVETIRTANTLATTPLVSGEIVFIKKSDGKPITTITAAGFKAAGDFTIMSRWKNRHIISAGVINTNRIVNAVARDLQSSVLNEWSTIIENENITTTIKFKVQVVEDKLIKLHGNNDAATDFIVELAPASIKSVDANKKVYINHVLTKLMYDKINALNSSYYEALVETEDNSYIDGSKSRFDSSDEAALSTYIGTFADRLLDPDVNDEYIAADNVLKPAPTMLDADAVAAADGDTIPRLKLVLKAKDVDTDIYRDVEINYSNPRGVRLLPVIILNDSGGISFTEDVKIGFPIGAGYDLRDKEWRNMSSYTILNGYPLLSDMRQSPDLLYQFDTDTFYHTISFEYDTDKAMRAGLGDKRRRGIIIGVADAFKARYTSIHKAISASLTETV